MLRRSLAAAYVGMTAREFDQAVAIGDMPDPLLGDRWDRHAIDDVIDRMTGRGVVDWRSLIGRPASNVDHERRRKSGEGDAGAATQRASRSKSKK